MKTINRNSMLTIFSLFIFAGLVFSSCQKEKLQNIDQTEVQNSQTNQRNIPGDNGGNGAAIDCYQALAGLDYNCSNTPVTTYTLAVMTYSATACWDLVNAEIERLNKKHKDDNHCGAAAHNACIKFPCP